MSDSTEETLKIRKFLIFKSLEVSYLVPTKKKKRLLIWFLLKKQQQQQNWLEHKLWAFKESKQYVKRDY